MIACLAPTAPPIGPILFLDDIVDGQLQLAALFIASKGQNLPPIELETGPISLEELADYPNHKIWVARFKRPSNQPSSYSWGNNTYQLAANFTTDMNIAYVSCNGEEHGDLEREDLERNTMWKRLADLHKEHPVSLLLHGGDQIYADEATDGHPLSENWPDELPTDPSREDLDDLFLHLRQRFFERYAFLYSAPDFAYLAARVPSVMQWDDHDICDGWGSLRRSRTYSPVGQTLFTAAREAFLTFQAAAREGHLPSRFADPRGHHMGWHIQVGDLRILTPDLRGQRTRREIMGPSGWAMMETAADAPFHGHTFMMSSVPLLGPRLSILEAIMVAIPSMQKYEDDLRDQWQSRAHRDSWRRMLNLALRMCEPPDQDLTILSGEIHLATRATMRLSTSAELHQLVASGITHRPPPAAWARMLGALSWLGEDPLPDHPVRIRKIPGQQFRYVAERNFLTLHRVRGQWSSRWHFESTGPSSALAL